MSSIRRVSVMRHVTILSAVAAFAAAFASAQFAPSPNPSSSVSATPTEFSSSSLGTNDESPEGAAALPSAPAPRRADTAQNGQNGGYDQNGGYQSHSFWSHLTFEAGGGANAPAGDKTYITWGGNFTLGGGYRFNKELSALLEYQFIDDKIPGAIIAEAGASGGHDHIWSFTVDPVYDLFPKSSNDAYVTGGGGFYRKVTDFTILEPTQYCTYFYCGYGYAPQTAGHFSSNQGGWNIGGGYLHRFGGMYGESKVAFFAEVRYLDVLSPPVSKSPNGLGVTTVAADTKVIPITFGVRW
ncbi:MAG: hypothetical protein WAM85_11875 [Terracidiphilus sp.]